MKLKTEMESYDVRSLSGINEGVIRMRKHCETLRMLAEFLDSRIRAARADGFQDINTDRAEELIREFLKKMQRAEEEYSELSESVKAFMDKIEDLWSPWG